MNANTGEPANETLIRNLHDLHEQALAAIGPWNDADAGRQLHADLSPACWHVGHIAVVEAYWLREVVLGEAVPASWPALYFPERIGKEARAAALPEKAAVMAFAAGLFAGNTALMADLLSDTGRHPLLERAYLAHFLVQHAAQHNETLAQIAQQRALRGARPFTVNKPLVACDPVQPALEFPPGFGRLGNPGEARAYDNELPQHRVRHARFRLSAQPVTNAEFFGFMQSGGYERSEYWSTAGWRWRVAADVQAPEHWRRDPGGNWHAIEPSGPAELAATDPVAGISWHEAQAFARYSRCRLPTEAEWEHAADCGAIGRTAAWEWCANNFYPYPGYRSFPYSRYSLPWFDGRHFALRGGSRHTHASVRRTTFRNFFTADKRHLFAGLRLANGGRHV